MSDRITAPFTPAQVKALNAFQRSGKIHPFTCGGNRSDQAHREYAARHREDMGQLIATEDGWRCPVCDYEQNWAHAWMAQPLPNGEG
jgi:hypothetical protein